MECLRWADEARDEEHRSILLDMAKLWAQTALDVERAWALGNDETSLTVPESKH